MKQPLPSHSPCFASYPLPIGASYLQKGVRKRKRGTCSYDEMLGDIRTDWNQKYREYNYHDCCIQEIMHCICTSKNCYDFVIGAVCGEGRIPYSDPGRMKCVMVGAANRCVIPAASQIYRS